ncbi:hypothetical protein ACLQ3C_12655 [Gordonia sp. DT30]|uniref:hypothetical protein n=1 Tax=Gordonia sp. DT30 TaxID=3416546 RepID=UPI003CEB4BFD
MTHPDPSAQRPAFTSHPAQPAQPLHPPDSDGPADRAPFLSAPGYLQSHGLAIPPPAEPVSRAARIIAGVLAGAGLLAVVAAFLPWTGGAVRVTGVGYSDVGASDGVMTALFGVSAFARGVADAFLVNRLVPHPVGIRAVQRRLNRFFASLVGACIVVFAVGDISRVGDLSAQGVHVGIGLWLTLLAGVVVLLAGIAALIKRR